MKTYPTIKTAFANGTGDCFFTKDGEYLAVSRKAPMDYLFDAGFTFMQHSEVIKLANIQNPPAPFVAPVPVVMPKRTNRQDNSYMSYGYYDDFPDAYNQYL